MITLTEVIFEGSYQNVNYAFLDMMIADLEKIRYNFPEDEKSSTIGDIVNVLTSNEYVDFVISPSTIFVDRVDLRNVFVNISCDSGRIDMLLFFDIKDLVEVGSYKEIIELLKSWAEKICSTYSFDSFVGRLDNGDSEECYFDNKGWGPLYYSLETMEKD